MVPVYFDAGVCTYTVFVAKYERYNGRYLLLVYLQT